MGYIFGVDISYRARRRGRPTIRSKEVVNEICRRIACGESLRHICLDPKIPVAIRFSGGCAMIGLVAVNWTRCFPPCDISNRTKLNISRVRTRNGRKKALWLRQLRADFRLHQIHVGAVDNPIQVYVFAKVRAG